MPEFKLVAGVDEVRGGTWFGISDGGLAVGITNFRGDPGITPPLSRGALVLDLLKAQTTADSRARLRSVNPSDFGPFNIWFGNTEELFVAYGRHDHSQVEIEEIGRGVHVLTNDRLDASLPKVGHVQNLTAKVSDWDQSELVPALSNILSDHVTHSVEFTEKPAFRLDDDFEKSITAVCSHTEEYGTTSGSILLLKHNATEYYFMNGAPCVTEPLLVGK